MKLRSLVVNVIVLVAAILVAGAPVYACTSVVVGKNASADGSVMTSHTCDGQYDFRLTVVPGKTHAPGTMRPVYKGGGASPRGAAPVTKVGEIPEVSQTYTYYNIAYPFMNEFQVTMGETTIGGLRELYNPQGWFEIWELQRIALERAKTAREAIKIMGELAEKYGYGDYGECLTVVDKNEAWVFEIFGATPLWTPDSGKPGAVWAAQRVPDDEIFVSANRSRIGRIDLSDPDNFMASSNVFELAQELGWWDPSKGEFVFNKVYGPKDNYYNARREWRVLSWLAPSLNLDPWGMEFPFSIKPEKKVTPRDIMAINRDHYEGTEFDLTKGMAAGPFGNPNRYATSTKLGAWERAISMFRCSYSWVSQSRSWLPDPVGGVVWFGLDAPHSTCYVPLYAGMTRVPKSFSVGTDDTFNTESAWWAFNFVSNWADLKYSYMIEDIKKAYTQFENEAFAIQPAIEKAAVELYANDPKLAVEFLTNYSNSFAQRVVDAWWTLGKTLVSRYHDGYVDGKTVGYPEEWLKAVGYGPLTKPAGK